MPAITQIRSRYAPDDVKCGIVHLGLGAFHRAHQAVYIESWLNKNRGGHWGIRAANIRSNRAVVEQLERQGCRYHVVEYRDRRRVTVREVNAIREALFAAEDKQRLLAVMAAPETRIVSLAVTEKAYCLSPADGGLLTADPAVAHDIAEPRAPRTVPGVLLEALRLRRAAGLRPFTVLCCDNMPENGVRTASAVIQLAESVGSGAGGSAEADLAGWIRDEVAFPSTMVDRIVPAATAASRRELESLLGFDDPAAVRCEAFSQWVIEERFSAGRPDWETVGVQMVGDVRPIETMKLRLLNGSHSLLAYVGLLFGYETVAGALADPVLEALVHRYLDEARATLRVPSDVDLDAYAERLIARFRNDALEHRLTQIAMDGSQKLPQRWLEGALESLERGLPVDATAAGVAAWIHYVRGRDRHQRDDVVYAPLGGRDVVDAPMAGRDYVVDDPMAETLARCHAGAPAVDVLVDRVLGLKDVFPPALGASAPFRALVADAYRMLADGRVPVAEGRA